MLERGWSTVVCREHPDCTVYLASQPLLDLGDPIRRTLAIHARQTCYWNLVFAALMIDARESTGHVEVWPARRIALTRNIFYTRQQLNHQKTFWYMCSNLPIHGILGRNVDGKVMF